MLGLGDGIKGRVLEEVASTLNPDAWRTGDESPHLQLPHILSSYRLAWGSALGLRGAAAAQCDWAAQRLGGELALDVARLYVDRFSERALIEEIMADVNQPR